jgi:hypothetical protein
MQELQTVVADPPGASPIGEPAALAIAVPTGPKILLHLMASPAGFSLTEDEQTQLQRIRLEWQIALLEVSAGIRKADDATENSVADDIARLIDAAAAADRQVNEKVQHLLGPGRYRRAALAAATSLDQALTAPADEKATSKDEKTAEIELAAKVLERLMGWAKLFAGVVAIPAALIVALLAMLGISKYSDFTSLVTKSEEQLQGLVSSATSKAAALEAKLADVNQKQTQAEQKIDTLSKDLKDVRERLAFPSTTQSVLTPETQKQIEKDFAVFQAYIIGLGYAPSGSTLQLRITKDKNAPTATYQEGNIVMQEAAARDLQMIYREYMHHVLYSKMDIRNVGPERSALESGIADYLVASYTGVSKLYQISYGKAIDFDEAKRIQPVLDHGERFPAGAAWTHFFLKLRTVFTREAVDKALLSSWFDVPKTTEERAVPGEVVAKLLSRLAPNATDPKRAIFVKIAKDRGAPVPTGM